MADVYTEYLDLHFARPSRFVRIRPLPSTEYYSLYTQHYFREIEPALSVLPVPLYKWLKDIATENEQDMGLIHPVLPNQVWTIHYFLTIPAYQVFVDISASELPKRTDWSTEI